VKAGVAHLADEFTRRLQAAQAQGQVADPRLAHIERLKLDNANLRQRLVDRDAKIEELTLLRTAALSHLAAQRDEIERLRRTQRAPTGIVREVPTRPRLVPGPADQP